VAADISIGGPPAEVVLNAVDRSAASPITNSGLYSEKPSVVPFPTRETQFCWLDLQGVDIDPIVRDIYRPQPGLEGINEITNIYSIVGLFPEHS